MTTIVVSLTTVSTKCYYYLALSMLQILLADRTARMQATGMMTMSSVCPSVCDAVHCG